MFAWKEAAKVYGKKTAELQAMSNAEFSAYYQKWSKKALLKAGETNDPRWWGFLDAVEDELTRRDVAAHPEELAEADIGWLAGVLGYLYEEKETPKPLEV